MRDVSYIAANLREADEKEIHCQLPEEVKPEEVAYRSIASGESWSAYYKGIPMAAFGFQPYSEGVLVGWAYGRDGMERTIPAITRFIFTERMPEWLEQGIRRVEVRTIETHVSAHRWLEAAGAKKVCSLPQWGRSGELFYLYAWMAGDIATEIERRWTHVHRNEDTGYRGARPARTDVAA